LEKLTSILSIAALAAFVPVAQATKTGWFSRVLDRFTRRPSTAPVRPEITTDHGWTLIRCEDPDGFRAWLEDDEVGFPFKEGEEPSLGSHLLVELYGCDPDSLKLENTVGEAMRTAAIQSEATVVTESFHEFKPYGVSGAVIIQESHYTIHTWPEHRYAAVDLFYCGGTIHVHRAMDVLRERFRPTKMKFLVVRRGLQSEVDRY